MNKCVFMGRFVRDPETRQSAKGDAICNFTLAVDRDYKDANGERLSDFIDFVAFRRTAEFISKYFAKGRMAVVAGHLQIDSYTDKDGNRRKAAKVVVDEIHFGDSKREQSSGGAEQNAGQPEQTAQAPSYAPILDDDAGLPF
ncbi:MAG: single-stranded DNA-binding protein [Ruminococcus sp.]|nr:single-stranded DNA-binding protein [Ruminococcus sp.]